MTDYSVEMIVVEETVVQNQLLLGHVILVIGPCSVPR
jgi:hypothetical protein